MISDKTIEEIKYRNDIENVISSYLPVKRRGKNLVCLCPFHSEKTPSFTVYPDTQSFFCFGCGAGGDVVTFVKRMENLDYREALLLLAERAGMKVEEEKEDRDAKLRTRILEINRSAAKYFYKNLCSDAGETARKYLVGRGLSAETVNHFGLGYALDEWDALLKKLKADGFSEREIEAANVAVRGKKGSLYDCFRNKVMFPIIDLRGNVIGFGARKLDGDGPKYINSSDTEAYKKSRNLFAMNFAKNDKSGEIILAEGYMDVISLHQAGFTNAVASLGTALTSEQARLISQYAGSVTIAYDSDEAGVKAARRAAEIFDAVGIKTRRLLVKDAKDPDEYIKKFGALKFKKLLEGSSSVTEYELDGIKEKYGIDTDDGKVNVLRESCEYIAGLSGALEREVYAGRLAGEVGVGKDAILRKINELVRKRESAREKKNARDLSIFSPTSENKAAAQFERAKNIKTAVAQEKLIACMLKYPEYCEKIVYGLEPEEISIAANRRIFELARETLEKSERFDFTKINAELPIDEINRLSSLMAACEIKFSDADVEHYIRTVKDAAAEFTPEKAGSMTDEEYLEKMRAEIKKKK